MVRILTFCQLPSEVPGSLNHRSSGASGLQRVEVSMLGHHLQRKNTFPFFLRGSLAGLIITVVEDRLTGENKFNFIYSGAPRRHEGPPDRHLRLIIPS